MLQMSKLLPSRNQWKSKAIQRAHEIREQRKTPKRYQAKIAELQRQLQPAGEKQKKLLNSPLAPVVEITPATETRTLCVLLMRPGIVSYRSIPRILQLLHANTSLTLGWIPHFTSVINWTLRVGLGLLLQVKPLRTSGAAIIDHSIDIGTKKVLVVLRVSMAALSQRGSAIQLQDGECIGVTVSETVNGETLSQDLEKIFNRAGLPAVIIKDNDSTLQKGVRLWSEKQENSIPVRADLGHLMATALKPQFEKATAYQQFISLLNQGANHLRQTDLAFLIPPKLRLKGRFQSINQLAKWGEPRLLVFAVKGRAKQGSLLARLRTAMPGFWLLKPFLTRFAKTTKVVSPVMEILKQKGLEQNSYEICEQLSEELPKHSKVKTPLPRWLQQHLEIQKPTTSLPLLVSSDIIESLFGQFKQILERSP